MGDAATARPAGWVVATWGALSLTAAAYYLRAVVALRQERRSWRVNVAGEMPVWVSEKTGPAVVGFLRSIVVTPAWGLALEERERRLLLRHEAEHVEAWDPLLLLVGMVAVAAVPWSPAGWWSLHRLRLAIEVDCDRRVLRAVPDVAAYGSLLLDVGERVTTGHAAVAAFAERRSALGERIEAMTARRPRRAGVVWTARSVFAVGIVAVACRVPAPQAPASVPGADTAGIAAVAVSAGAAVGAPAGEVTRRVGRLPGPSAPGRPSRVAPPSVPGPPRAAAPGWAAAARSARHTPPATRSLDGRSSSSWEHFAATSGTVMGSRSPRRSSTRGSTRRAPCAR